MAEETEVYFVDVVRELLEKQHAKTHDEGPAEVIVDATVSQTSLAALRAVGKEALAPVADAVTSSGIGLLAKAAIITAQRKFKSRAARQQVAAKIDKKAERVSTRRAARRLLMRKLILEGKGTGDNWGTSEKQFERRATRRREHKAKIARVSRAMVARMAANFIRSNGRDMTAGTIATYAMLNVPAAALAAQGLAAIGAAGWLVAAAAPIAGIVAGAAVFVGTAVVVDRGLRAVTGGDAPLGPLFDYAVTRMLDKGDGKEAWARMKQRYAKIGTHMLSFFKTKDKPAAVAPAHSSRGLTPARRKAAYAGALPTAPVKVERKVRAQRTLGFTSGVTA